MHRFARWGMRNCFVDVFFAEFRGPKNTIGSFVTQNSGQFSSNDQYPASYSNSTYESLEKSKHMQKLLTKKGGNTTKKRWFEPHLAAPLEAMAPKVKKGPSHRHMARLRQISHVLYDKIVNVINSGELSQELFEKQINITDVKVLKAMNGINVYWEADRSDWDEVEKLLIAKAGKLRSILISYHVLGNIPPVKFVRTKNIYNMSQLTHLLDSADYGPDYTPGLTPNETESHRQEIADNIDAVSADSIDSSYPVKTDRHQQPSEEQAYTKYSYDYDKESSDENSVPDDFYSKNFDNQCQLNETHKNGPYKDPLSFQSGSGKFHERTLNEQGEEVTDAKDVISEMNFRSDLYGLQRDEMMKKITAKKKGVSPSDMVAPENETLSLKLDSMFKKNIIVSKSILKNRSRKEERKMKARMLERNVSDFL